MSRTPLLDHFTSLIPTISPQIPTLGDSLADVLHAPPAAPPSQLCFYAPQQYEPGYAYPLIVWMHSSHSSEGEIRQVMPLLSTQNYVGVAPRGVSQSPESEFRFDWETSAEGIAEACERVRECVVLAQDEFNIHRDRVFLAGYGQGGTMALRVALQLPELFAGVVSLGGRVPRGQHVYSRLNAARHLPILLSVSPQEGIYSLGDLKDDLRFLHCGGFPLDVHLFPEGDGLTTVMLARCNHWIMQLACPQTVCSNIIP